MKTIYEIQDEYARELGWDSMSDMLVNADGTRESLNLDYVEIAKRYATESIKADRERVAKGANVRTVFTPVGHYHEIDKQSILNLPIELK